MQTVNAAKCVLTAYLYVDCVLWLLFAIVDVLYSADLMECEMRHNLYYVSEILLFTRDV